MAFTPKYTAADAEASRRIATIARELSAELGAVDALQGSCWFDAIEREAVAIGDAVNRALMAERSAEQPTSAGEAPCPRRVINSGSRSPLVATRAAAVGAGDDRRAEVLLPLLSQAICGGAFLGAFVRPTPCE